MERLFWALIGLAIMACASVLPAPMPLSQVVAPGPIALMATGLVGFTAFLFWTKRRKA